MAGSLGRRFGVGSRYGCGFGRGARHQRSGRRNIILCQQIPGSEAVGERLVIDGPCLSACTLFTAFLPRNQVCVTRRAVLGFHAASYYDDARRSLVPTRAGTRLVMRLYPAAIRNWIERHGGLRPRIIAMRGRELASLYNTCR